MSDEFEGLPKTRKEALAVGEKTYFTGKPCKHGHVNKRYTSTRQCLGCHKSGVYETKEEKMARYYRNHGRNKKLKRQWYHKNKDKIAMGKDSINKRRRERYRLDNDRHRECQNKYRKNMYDECSEYRLRVMCRGMVTRCIKLCQIEKESSTFETLGYGPSELKSHLEANFIDGMSWDNHGSGWEVDHKIPITRYLEQGVTDLRIINSLENLLPMWSEHNKEKGNKTLEEYYEMRPEIKDIYV